MSRVVLGLSCPLFFQISLTIYELFTMALHRSREDIRLEGLECSSEMKRLHAPSLHTRKFKEERCNVQVYNRNYSTLVTF